MGLRSTSLGVCECEIKCWNSQHSYNSSVNYEDFCQEGDPSKTALDNNTSHPSVLGREGRVGLDGLGTRVLC